MRAKQPLPPSDVNDKGPARLHCLDYICRLTQIQAHMKKLIYLATVISLALLTNASSTHAQEYDSRLSAKFSKKELKSMINSNDPQLAYLTYYLSNGFQVEDIPVGKEDSQLPEISLKSIDPKDINLLALPVEQHEFARRYYRISGTNKMLALLPRQEVEARFTGSTK
jgi:hypothetical protein